MLKHKKDHQAASRHASAKGFTLIELLVVIVILGILAAVIVFAVGGFRTRSQNAACESERRTLETALAAGQTYDTPIITEAGLVSADLLDDVSPNFDINATPAVVAIAGGKCA